MNLKEFGLRLQKLRLEHHLSQEYLAEEIGCSKGAISFYELGKRTPDIIFLDKVSRYFKVSLDFLMGRENVNTEVEDTEDKFLAEVCNFLYLSEKAVTNIEEFTDIVPPVGVGHSESAIFNLLCETGDFMVLCYHLDCYCEIYNIIKAYEEIIQKGETDDLSAYEEKCKFAKEELSYFKWNIVNYISKIADCVADFYSKNRLTPEQTLSSWSSVQALLKKHKEQTPFFRDYFCKNDSFNKNNDNN